MDTLLLLALAAMLVFWLLGAHNRLMTLRNAIADAWEPMDNALQQRAALLSTRIASQRQRGEQASTAALDEALQLSQRAAAALRSRPAGVEQAAALAAAEEALREQLAMLPTDAALDDVAQRLDFGRRLYNDTAQAYDAAARQFPTRVVARLFRFGASGRL